MNAEVKADVATTKERILQLDNDIDALGTSSGYVTDALRTEENQLAKDVAEYEALVAPEATDTGERSFIERQSDIDSIVTASPAAAQAMRQELVGDVENRITEIDNQLQDLPADSFSGYIRPGLQTERDELWDLMPTGAKALAEWYEDASDGIVVKSERFTAGGEIELPAAAGVEGVVGAAINFQKNTAADGSITVKASINGTLGLEVANTLGLNVNGDLGTEYKFSNEAEAQEFIDALSDAANDKGGFVNEAPYFFEVGPVNSVVDVINEYSDNHSSYRAGVELEAEIETGVGGHRVDVSAAAGVERKFDTDLSTNSTTYYARMSASTGADLGLEEKFGLKGDTQVRVTFDDEGNASTLTILGGVSGSAPVRGLVNSLDVVDGTRQDFENVIPGSENKETLAANVAITLDISDPNNPVAIANLVNSLIGAQDQSFGEASADLFDRAEVRVGITTTESSAVSADIEVLEFNVGNSEVSTLAAFAKAPEGDFQQVG